MNIPHKRLPNENGGRSWLLCNFCDYKSNQMGNLRSHCFAKHPKEMQSEGEKYFSVEF